ncbi:MAG: DMT family transporter [Proteobacteria bacterium]|nr:DMT family transporter [Pseudomonadota bacterium]
MSAAKLESADSAAARERERSGVLIAIALVLVSGCIGISVDAVSKDLTRFYPVTEIIWARHTLQLLALLPFLPVYGWRRLARTAKPLLQVSRSLFQISSSFIYVLAISYIGIADAIAIYFVAPLLVTVLSVPMLGEIVGPRRIAAVLVGFFGVVIVLRPGFGHVHWALFLPLAVAVLQALYQVNTRLLTRHDPGSTTLAYTAVTGALITSAIAPFQWVWPDGQGWLLMLLMGGTAALSNYMNIRAFTLAQASVLAPFAYVQIIWAVPIGYLWFGDLPDAWTAAGTSVIVASGLYVLHRERVRRRTDQAA